MKYSTGGLRFLMFVILALLAACANQPVVADRMPAANSAQSKLNWGLVFDPSKNTAEPIRSQLNRVVEIADGSLNIEFHSVTSLHLAGTLNSDPERVESEKAKATFPQIFDLAICARLATSPLKDQCLVKVRSAIMTWVSVYQVSGNPIDEASFSPVFLGIDLVLPLLSNDDRGLILDWIKQFATEGDRFFAKMNPNTDTRLKNNWMAWRLFIRGTVAKITGDPALTSNTQAMIHDFVYNNILRDQSGNLLDGKTYDFVQRDALHYHLYDLEPLVRLRLSAPELIDATSYESIEKSLLFIKPFYTGDQQHIEFVHTTVQFDITRAQAGQTDYMNLPWNPTQARVFLREARPAFPSIQPWTDNVVDVKYDPMIKLLSASFGETTPMGSGPPSHQ